jgi:hypothetical protein
MTIIYMVVGRVDEIGKYDIYISIYTCIYMHICIHIHIFIYIYQLDHSVLILGCNAVILPFNLEISSFLSTSLYDRDDDNQRSIKLSMNPLTSLSAISSLPDVDDDV